MTDVFNLSIPHLRQWSQRQAVDHRIQNEPVEALNQMTTGIAPPRMRAGIPISISVALAQFRLKHAAQAYPDHFVCRTWDGETEGTEDVLVAKPWLLRQTPFDRQVRGTVLYYYLSPVIRDATAVVGTRRERQEIIPHFRTTDIIYASNGIVGGTGVVWRNEPVTWLALSDGRAWAWTA